MNTFFSALERKTMKVSTDMRTNNHVAVLAQNKAEDLKN
jgi:hypothetical protein